MEILIAEYLKADREHKVGIIQKYMKGYWDFNWIKQVREEAVKSQKISSSSENTFARTINQQELLKMLSEEKAEVAKEILDIEGK